MAGSADRNGADPFWKMACRDVAKNTAAKLDDSARIKLHAA